MKRKLRQFPPRLGSGSHDVEQRKGPVHDLQRELKRFARTLPGGKAVADAVKIDGDWTRGGKTDALVELVQGVIGVTADKEWGKDSRDAYATQTGYYFDNRPYTGPVCVVDCGESVGIWTGSRPDDPRDHSSRTGTPQDGGPATSGATNCGGL